MKYFADVILYKIQNYHWFWKYGFGKSMTRMTGVYAVQFARSKSVRISGGYSFSGGVEIFVDHIFLTRKLAEKVYEKCMKEWRPADSGNGFIHDDNLVLWEYNNGYSIALRNYEDEIK